jgi:hypothetical protein
MQRAMRRSERGMTIARRECVRLYRKPDLTIAHKAIQTSEVSETSEV